MGVKPCGNQKQLNANKRKIRTSEEVAERQLPK